MEIIHNTYHDIEVIIVQGVITLESYTEIRESLEKLPVEANKEAWIECTHISKVSLSKICFSIFVSMLLELRANNTKLVLFGLDATAERLLALLKINHLFKIVPKLEDAYLGLSRKGEMADTL